MNETWYGFGYGGGGELETADVVKATPKFVFIKHPDGSTWQESRNRWFPTREEAIAAKRRVLEADMCGAWTTFTDCRAELDKFKRLYGDPK